MPSSLSPLKFHPLTKCAKNVPPHSRMLLGVKQSRREKREFNRSGSLGQGGLVRSFNARIHNSHPPFCYKSHFFSFFLDKGKKREEEEECLVRPLHVAIIPPKVGTKKKGDWEGRKNRLFDSFL